jgi:hypothetical protein
MRPEALLAPNPVRSWKKKHDRLVNDLQELHTELVMAVQSGVAPTWVLLEIECLLND